MRSYSPLPALLFALMCAGCNLSTVADTKLDSPNVILIVVDDLGFSDLGAFGGEVRTPNIDRLASSGIRLTNFHAAPSCSPSRAMLLTGQDNHRVGLGAMKELQLPEQRGRPGYEGYLIPSITTLSEAMSAAGYTTLMAGKWHMGIEPGQWPTDRGFDRSFAMLQGAGSHVNDTGYSGKNPQVTYVEDDALVSLPPDFYSTTEYSNRLLDYIADARELRKPYFAYLAYTAPHWPVQAPRDRIDALKARYDVGWDRIRAQRCQALKKMGWLPAEAVMPTREQHVPPWSSLSAVSRERQARKMAAYAAMIEIVDENIGRLMADLTRHGELERTLIVLLSDNGPDARDLEGFPIFKPWIQANYDDRTTDVGTEASFTFAGPGWAQVSATPWTGSKTLLTEGGTRVPLIITLPQQIAGGVVNHGFLTIGDLMPTMLEAVGYQLPNANFDGESLWPSLAAGRVEIPQDKLTVYEYAGQTAIYAGDWKAYNPDARDSGSAWQLRNLRQDPFERQVGCNVDAFSPLLIEQLNAALRAFVERVDVYPPLANTRVVPQC